jgi:hypothetical protein
MNGSQTLIPQVNPDSQAILLFASASPLWRENQIAWLNQVGFIWQQNVRANGISWVKSHQIRRSSGIPIRLGEFIGHLLNEYCRK